MQPIKPTPEQLAWQQAGFGVFFHFGINTFHDLEWSDGTLDPATFAPSGFDADEWIAVAKGAGARYVVLTAKHHDGFCLWPTGTTDYSVASSPWRDGRGDVVREVAAACRRAGMPLGLYLSPWDRHEPSYAGPAAYDAFYAEQLRELCTGYGPLFEIWFDGAGSEGRTYDWNRIMRVVEEHQPGAMVFNMGRPTIRWVGNEDGLASEPVDYVVTRTGVSMFTDDTAALARPRYLPPECDVPIRGNWFWHTDDAHTLKSREHLLGIFYRSIGLGAGLLLNLAPDRRGRIDPADAERLAETAAELRRRFDEPIPAALRGDTADFGRPVTIDHLELREDLSEGQGIGTFRVLADGVEIAAGTSVGVRRWLAFPPVTVASLTLDLTGTHTRLAAVAGFRTGHSAAPEVPGAV